MCYIIFVGRNPGVYLDNETMSFSYKNPATNKVWTRDDLYKSLQEMRRQRDHYIMMLDSQNSQQVKILNTDVLLKRIKEISSQIVQIGGQLQDRTLALAAKRAVR